MAEHNKIAKTLSAEELERFCERLRKERGVTLQKIADFYEEETGEKVSLMGATAFRNTTFAKHCERIRKAGSLATELKELRQEGASHTIADAASAIISQELLDKLINRDPDEELDLDVMSKIVKRLRDSDSRVRALEHTIEMSQLDAAALAMQYVSEIKKIAGDSSLDSGERIARVRKRLFGEKPSNLEVV
ncbi:MAG TPA: hypothetical protein VK961_06960 [Chthoniobacter sp.]|nr:hypothetical protein [Chthoniobacter sp.]